MPTLPTCLPFNIEKYSQLNALSLNKGLNAPPLLRGAGGDQPLIIASELQN